MRKALLLVLLIVVAPLASAAMDYPKAADRYKRTLIRWAHYYDGLDATIPMYAAQIHQESAWRPNVSSPYADGLTQFTPDTAEWIGSLYPELREIDVFNPVWAIKAMIRYNNKLAEGLVASDECNLKAMVLASYNGGKGWILRDKNLTEQNGFDRNVWWDNVENFSPRAKWAFEENRDYPRRILLEHQTLYESWGGPLVCEEMIYGTNEDPPDLDSSGDSCDSFFSCIFTVGPWAARS